MGFVFTVLNVAPIHSHSVTAAEPPRCDGSPAIVGENVPANTIDEAHSVVHVASVHKDGQLLGWLYQDKDRSSYIATFGQTSASPDTVFGMLISFGVRPPTNADLKSWTTFPLTAEFALAPLSKGSYVITVCN